MSRRTRSIAGVVVLLVLGWWLFGFTTYREGPYTTQHFRRWGRVTRIDISANDDRKVTRERIYYTWSEPYEAGDPTTSCSTIPAEVWQDWNGDGQWDTWLFRSGPNASGDCSVNYRIDLTNDGQHDWQFISSLANHEEARTKIISRRGF